MITNNIRYGFELEAYFDDDWLRGMEPSDYHDGYERDDLNSYRLETDGSLHSRYDDLSPAELISPILYYDNFDNDMDTLRTMLSNVAIKTDSTCGLHINISIKGLNIRDIWSLGKVKKARDEFLNRTSNGNYFRSYAKKIDNYRTMFSGERYNEFNLRHDDYIEWRAVNAGYSDDIESIIKTIKTALDCIVLAINTNEPDTFIVAYSDSNQQNCDYFEYARRVRVESLISRGECQINPLSGINRRYANHIPSIRHRRKHSSFIGTIVINQVYNLTKKEIK